MTPRQKNEPSGEQLAEMLSMMKTDLGVMSATLTVLENRWTKLLHAANEAIFSAGATLVFSSFNDRELCTEYAEWLWRRRDSSGAMGPGLRKRLNARIFAEKAAAPEG